MKQKLSKGRKAYLFLTFAGPSMLFFFLVTVIPLIYGIYLTFTDWDGISSQVNSAGLTNYVGAFKDTAFFRALGLTVVYSAISVITINLIAFALAYVLTSGIKGQRGSIQVICY